MIVVTHHLGISDVTSLSVMTPPQLTEGTFSSKQTWGKRCLSWQLNSMVSFGWDSLVTFNLMLKCFNAIVILQSGNISVLSNALWYHKHLSTSFYVVGHCLWLTYRLLQIIVMKLYIGFVLWQCCHCAFTNVISMLDWAINVKVAAVWPPKWLLWLLLYSWASFGILENYHCWRLHGSGIIAALQIIGLIFFCTGMHHEHFFFEVVNVLSCSPYMFENTENIQLIDG